MKRRIFAMLLSLAMLFTLAPTAFAVETIETSGNCGATESDNVTWKLEQNNSDGENPTYTLTISGSGDMADFTSPTEPNAEGANIAPWYTVLTADETTNLVPITEIKINEGITGIGNFAFAYTKVVKAEFPSTVSYYGNYIFRYCSELTTVDWTNYKPAPMGDTYVPGRPEGIYIPEGMFDFCENLKQCKIGETTYAEGVLALPENVTGICTAAFRDTAFNTIDFSSDGLKQITAVGPYAFARTKITSVTIPDDVDFYPQTNQLANTFNKCKSLTSVTFEDAVTKIPGAMFSDCTELNTVSIDKENSQISEIGARAFASCSRLTSFTFPTGLKTIGGYAFVSSGLTSLDLGEVETLDQYSFFGCKDLAEVKIVGTPGLKIDSTVFGTTSGYPSAAPIKKFTLENGSLTAFSSAAVDALEELHFGDGVTEIPACSYGKWQGANWVYVGAKNLKTVTLGKNITSLPANAFMSSQITEITIPDNVTSIGNNAFNGCESLETVAIGKASQLQSIGNGVFGSTKIKTIYIPAKVTSIGQQPFFNLATLTTVDMSDVESETVNIGGWCFGYDSNVVASNRPLRTFYVSNAGLINRLTNKNNCIDNRGSRVANAAFVVTNGGTVDSSKTGLAAVSRAGYGVTWTSGDETNITNPENTTLVKDKTYTATWTLVDGNVEITYNPNISGGNDKNVVRVAVKGADTTVASALFSRTGYTFAGWNTVANGTGTDYKAGDTIKADTTITLYAQWTLDKPTISGTTTAVYGNTVTLTASTAATGASYQWYKGGKEVANATDKSLTRTNVADSGAYTVKITVGTDTATSEPTTVTITKATPTVSISADKTSLTGSGTVKLTVSSNGVPENGTVSVTCDNGITVNNKDGMFTATLPNETKTYTFTASYAGDDNHNNAKATCKVSVTHRSSGSSSGSSTTTSNSVSASTASNGKVSLDKNTAKKGDTVTVTVTPDAGYQLDKLTVTDKNGNVLKLTDKGDGKYSFTMPDGKVEIKAVFAKKVETSPFDDVSTDAYYYKAVQWAQEKGITDGISSDLFGPKQPCTRSQIVTFLWRAAGSPEPKGTAAGMTDVVPGSYYAKAVAWAVENGITTGTAEGTFSPDATCTRAQAVTFLARAQNAKATGKTAFSDVPADSYFADAVAWAQANGVTTGTSETTFSPDNDCTRAQIVTFLYRANQGT